MTGADSPANETELSSPAMSGTRTLRRGAITVYDYRCPYGPDDAPFPEAHSGYSLSYVRRGSFGYRAGGESAVLVPGALLVGAPGEEYCCTHDHSPSGGTADECLSFHFTPETLAELGFEGTRLARHWRSGAVAPQPALAVLGEWGQSVAASGAFAALEEVALLLAQRFLALDEPAPARHTPTPQDRRRAIEAAHWLEERAASAVDLATAAAAAGLSPFHFLRLFRAVLGVTPYQFLLRSRLRRATRLLATTDLPVTEIAFESGFADLSNFVRTFRRAAELPPLAFRRRSRRDRKNLQDAAGVRGGSSPSTERRSR